MKKIGILLMASIMIMNLSACVQKSDDKRPTYMYPAFKIEENKKLWGYIDPNGDFLVDPIYHAAYEFTLEGLAKVEKEGLFGVINSEGGEILEPRYESITDFQGGYFVAFDGKKNQLFNYKGEMEFAGENEYTHIGPYSDGLFTFSMMNEENEIRMGYIGKDGGVVIGPKYSKAYNFIDGKAIVQENQDENYKIIDKNHAIVRQLDYKDIRATASKGKYIFQGENELYGLIDLNGDIIIEEKFNNIVDVDEEHILVNIIEGKEDFYGVLDKKGKYIIQPEYRDIILLGHGYFALSKERDENGDNIYAISNSKGRMITEYKYYNVGGREGKIKNNLISVYDGKNTYAIDLKGNKSKDVPVILGPGEISFDGKVITANISGKKSYYNAKKELLWEEINDYSLEGGAVVTEKIYLDGKVIDIRYPVVDGLKKKEVEDNINKKLYEKFRKSYDLGEELKREDYKSYRVDYNVNRINDLLVIEQVVEVVEKDDIEAIVFTNIYNISLLNGNFYELKDLFQKDSGYLQTLTDIIRGIAEQKTEEGSGMYDLTNWEGVKADQDFIVGLATIDIYFKPDEILSYSEEFPRFTIEQEIIDDILDFNSEFWLTYSRNQGF